MSKPRKKGSIRLGPPATLTLWGFPKDNRVAVGLDVKDAAGNLIASWGSLVEAGAGLTLSWRRFTAALGGAAAPHLGPPVNEGPPDQSPQAG